MYALSWHILLPAVFVDACRVFAHLNRGIVEVDHGDWRMRNLKTGTHVAVVQSELHGRGCLPVIVMSTCAFSKRPIDHGQACRS